MMTVKLPSLPCQCKNVNELKAIFTDFQNAATERIEAMGNPSVKDQWQKNQHQQLNGEGCSNGF